MNPLMPTAFMALVLTGSLPASSPATNEPASLTVFAAASLTDAVTEIAHQFERDTQVAVRLNFAASSTLARQIAAGAPADVYFGGHTRWMDYLAEKECIHPATRRDILTNRLVVIGHRRAPLPEIGFEPGFDLARALRGRVAIADPAHAPAGIYARQALASVGAWEPLAGRLAPAANVRDALRLVQTGQCDTGIVYASDVISDDRVRILGVFPTHTHETIRYPAAVVARPAGRRKPVPSTARRFVDALVSPAAARVFDEHGFTPLTTAPSGLKADPTQATATLAPPRRVGGLTPHEWSALWLSLKVAGYCVAVLALPGILCGWLLARKRFPGKALLDLAVHAPLVLPPIVTGYLVLRVMGRRGPIGRHLEEQLGVSFGFTWYGAVLVAAIMGFPLMVRSVRLAIELVDRRIEQAASTLGASPARVWLTVTLPLALPGVVAGLFLAFARSLGEFGATITFAGNIEGQTRTLPLAIFNSIQTPGGDGPAMRLAMISLLLSVGALAASAVAERRLRLRGNV